MKNRIGSILVALVLALSMLPAAAWVAEDVYADLNLAGTPSDYSDADNWLAIPEITKQADTIYFYPTAYNDPTEGAADICAIDDASVRAEARRLYGRQATAFEDTTNVFAPYYRQSNIFAVMRHTDDAESFQKNEQRTDVFAALDYYFAHYNNGKPFILAGHSQGSMMIRIVLDEYFPLHPELAGRMIAAYAIGESFPNDWLAAHPYVKFAEGADDTGVIVSWNTEGPGNRDATFTPITYTVTFNANGGAGTMAAQDVSGAASLTANRFTRGGYTFSGWNTAADGSGTAYTDGASITPTTNLTLYAQWTANAPTPTPAPAPAYTSSSTPTSYPPITAEPLHGAVRVSPSSPTQGQKVTILPEPDQGYAVDAVTVTDANGKTIPVTDSGDGSYSFIQPAGRIVVTVSFRSLDNRTYNHCLRDETCPLNSFTDIDPAAWYHDGVHYVLENGIMGSVGGSAFAPDGTTSRAMIATILWRIAGEPAPSGRAGFLPLLPRNQKRDSISPANRLGANRQAAVCAQNFFGCPRLHPQSIFGGYIRFLTCRPSSSTPASAGSSFAR